MRKRFIAVIGQGRAGKSTIIQCLTGCHSKNFNDFVEDKAEDVAMRVICTSPQESGLSPKDLKSFVGECARRKGCIALVVAIQPTPKPIKRLSLEGIFKEVDSIRKFDNYAFIVDPPYDGESWYQFAGVESRILKVSPHTRVFRLDGTRFGALNANLITAASRVPY